MSKVIMTFSGQGNQYHRMGEELYKQNATFKYWIDRADSLMLELTSHSLVTHLYGNGDKGNTYLQSLEISHPLLFAVQFATAMAVCDIVKPDYLLGASLGEFVAMAVGGCFSFEAGFEYIVQQAGIFPQTCPYGAMGVILATREQIENTLSHCEYDFAAHSGPANQTISTNMANWTQIEVVLKERNLIMQKLPVQFGFHSRWIQGAEMAFRHLSKKLNLFQSSIPIVSCCSSAPLDHTDLDHLWNIVREEIDLASALKNIVDPDRDNVIDISPTSSIGSCLAAIFKHSPTIQKRTFKTVSPYKNTIKNLQLLAEISHKAKQGLGSPNALAEGL